MFAFFVVGKVRGGGRIWWIGDYLLRLFSVCFVAVARAVATGFADSDCVCSEIGI